MADSKMIDDLNEQLAAIRRILTSPDWSVWVTFLRKERRQYLQNKVNAAVKAKEWDEAQVALALLNDCDKQLELFRNFISDTESKLKQGVKTDGD